MERQGRKSFKTPLLDHKDEKGIIKHPFPMNLFLKPWRLSPWFYQVVKFGIVQYVCFSQMPPVSLAPKLFSLKWKLTISLLLQMIIKSLTALTALILEAFGVYCEGEFKWGCGYVEETILTRTVLTYRLTLRNENQFHL